MIQKEHLRLVYNADDEKALLMHDIMKFVKMQSTKELRAFLIMETPISLEDKITLRLLNYISRERFVEKIEVMLWNKSLAYLEEFHESIQDLI